MEENMIIESTEVEVAENDAVEVIEGERESRGGIALGLAAVAGVGVVIGLGKKYIAPKFSKEARAERLQKKLDKLEAQIAALADEDDAEIDEDDKKFNPKELFKKKNKKESEEA